jgi:hypothetical protein
VTAKNIKVVLNALNDFTADSVKEIVLDATSNLIEDTPRDTGWARNNWIPEIGPGTPGPVGDPERPRQAGAQQQQAVARIAIAYKLGMGIVTIYNNVPYINRLNKGHSKQAPSGFVQAAILRAVNGAGLGGSIANIANKSM